MKLVVAHCAFAALLVFVHVVLGYGFGSCTDVMQSTRLVTGTVAWWACAVAGALEILRRRRPRARLFTNAALGWGASAAFAVYLVVLLVVALELVV